MLRETAAEAVLRNRYLLGDPAVLPADPGSVTLRSAAGDKSDGKYVSDHFERGGRRYVIPDVDQHRDHPRRWRYDVCSEDGSDQYMADRAAAFFLYGVCCESVSGGRCLLSECRSIVQMRSGVFAV